MPFWTLASYAAGLVGALLLLWILLDWIRVDRTYNEDYLRGLAEEQEAR
ncbi:MAG TPA: hypothetical protein VIN09_01610 [Chloroflexota bacterium]